MKESFLSSFIFGATLALAFSMLLTPARGAAIGIVGGLCVYAMLSRTPVSAVLCTLATYLALQG